MTTTKTVMISKPTTLTGLNKDEIRTLSRIDFAKEMHDKLIGELSESSLRLVPSALDVMIDSFTKAIKDKSSVRLKGLGLLNVYHKESRKGARNVRTQEPAVVSARWVVSFKRGRSSRARDVFGWSDINEVMYQSIPQLSRDDVAKIHTTFINIIGEIADGKTRTEFRNFGSFYPSFAKERARYNPITGENKITEAKIQINFRSYFPDNF